MICTFKVLLLLMFSILSTLLGLPWGCHWVSTLGSRIPPPPPTLTLKGTLKYITISPSGFWLLSAVDVNGLESNYRLPDQPTDYRNNMPIGAGNVVSLTCVLANSLTKQCISILYAQNNQGFSREVITVNVKMRLLVVVVSLSDNKDVGRQPGANEIDVRNTFIGANGIADFFSQCSYHRMLIDEGALKVVPLELPYSEVLMGDCNDWTMQNALTDAVRLQLQQAGITSASFSNILHVLHQNPIKQCSFRGIAELPGKKSWFTPGKTGIFNKGTVMQELLHNFAMHHGFSKDGQEYEDSSTAMGRGESCPSAPELWRLGWADPLVQLNSASLPASTFKIFNLRATYLGPEGAMIKIIPDWLGENFHRKNLYLALRVKMGGDKDLLDEFDGKLSIHAVIKEYDTRFTNGMDPKISLVQVVSPRSSFDHTAYNLSVITGELVYPYPVITVKICRYIIKAKECKDNPWIFLPPPSPQPPSPRPPSPRPQSPQLKPLNPPPSANWDTVNSKVSNCSTSSYNSSASDSLVTIAMKFNTSVAQMMLDSNLTYRESLKGLTITIKCPDGVWSPTYGAGPNANRQMSDMMMKPQVAKCPAGHYVVAFKINTDLYDRIGDLMIICSDLSTYSVQSDNSPYMYMTPIIPTGFRNISLSVGWAIDSFLGFGSVQTGGPVVYTCPPGMLVRGISGGLRPAESFWMMNLQILCHASPANSWLAKSSETKLQLHF